MQIKFNSHLPPGYLETHGADGVGWKSDPHVRKELPEHQVANIVKRFERESRDEMERQRREGTCQPVSKTYTVDGIRVEIVRHPWERIPSVLAVRPGRG